MLGFVKMNSETDDSKPMIGETEIDDAGNPDESNDTDTAGVPNEIAADTDNVGDVSVEINVEQLIADIEASEDKDAARKREIRRRLEDVVEDQSLEDTYAIDLNEEAE